MDLAFGGSSLSLVHEEASGVASEVLTADVNTGMRFPDGCARDYYIPADRADLTDFAVIGTGTSGRLYIALT